MSQMKIIPSKPTKQSYKCSESIAFQYFLEQFLFGDHGQLTALFRVGKIL